jgi:hypothetical protein
LKFTIPKFDGGFDPEAYLTWELKVDKFFAFIIILKRKRWQWLHLSLMIMLYSSGSNCSMIEKKLGKVLFIRGLK